LRAREEESHGERDLGRSPVEGFGSSFFLLALAIDV
jgi:hypothetical protein